MTLLVTGFPSKIAALQFEWAWQNNYKTRHIAAHMRNEQTEKRLGINNKLSHLHTLLCVDSFLRWPLEVRFFAPDVHRLWQLHCAKSSNSIRVGIPIIEDFRAPPPKPARKRKGLPIPPTQSVMPIDDSKGITVLDFSYEPEKSALLKSISLLQQQTNFTCAVCNANMNSKQDLILNCSHGECQMLAHLTCLSRRFLSAESNDQALLPEIGKCPICYNSLSWMALARNLSLRIRGQTEVAQLLKKPRARKCQMSATEVVVEEDADKLEQEIQSTGPPTLPAFIQPTHFNDNQNDDAAAVLKSQYCKSPSKSRLRKAIQIFTDAPIQPELGLELVPSSCLPMPLGSTQTKVLSTQALSRVILNSDWDDIDDLKE